MDAFNWADLIEMEHDKAEFGACFLDPHTNELKPWGALFIKLGQAFGSFPLQPGVEAEFANALRASSRPAMTYLESGHSIGALIDAVPFADIAAVGAAMDAAMPEMLANIGALHSAWERSNVAALEALQAESPLGSIPTMRHAFFTARNENWARTIAARGPSEKRQLLVVGAMHLVGSDSLLETLSRCGLDARRVPS
ncbi:TraB/GumN family protein [Variovorax boronicumulans]|uniref:TraB/GumN family protein n=1 Tax=Variovorax boronicumulans TaxID=436515 RepID=UPI0027D7D59E|nr:TraB/GumN family protein [Variovorax boronicumulans]